MRLAVAQFYDRVLADPKVSHYFAGMDMAGLKRHQAMFLAQVLGGPAEYDGRTMAQAHAGLDISADDFARVGTHLLEVLAGLQVDRDVLTALDGALVGLEGDVVAADPDGPTGRGA